MKRKGWLHTNPDFSGGNDQEKAAFEEEERRRKKAPRLQIPTFGDNQHQVKQHCEQGDKKKATPTSKIGDSDDNESGKAEDAPSNNKEVSRPVATLLLPHVPLWWFSHSHIWFKICTYSSWLLSYPPVLQISACSPFLLCLWDTQSTHLFCKAPLYKHRCREM